MAESKEFSVVVRLSEFADLNGQLSNFDRDDQRQEYVKHFFLNKYGHGAGTLRVAQKQSKVKLTWLSSQYDAAAEESHLKALSAAKQGNYQEAINSWVKAIALNPSDPDFYFNLGIAFFERKNFIEAVENFKKALSICPIYYKAHLILGTVYLKIRKFAEAEHYLKESLVFYSSHPLAYLNLGAVYSILKRYDEGISMFLKSIEIAPNEIRAHFGLAKIYSLRGDVDKANYYFKKVIEINSNSQLVNHAKRAIAIVQPLDTPQMAGDNNNVRNAEQCYQEGYNAFLYSDYGRAVRMYTVYLQQKPKDDFVWYSLGEACARAGQLSRAVEALQKAIELNPSKGLYLKELAMVYSYLEKPELTIKNIEHANRLGKRDSVLLALWGKALLDLNDINDAVEKLEESIRLNPNNIFAKYNLAIASFKNNQTETAMAQLHEIMRNPIGSPLKIEAEQLVSSGLQV